MRKFYAVALLLVLLFVFSVPAMAQDRPGDEANLQIWGFGLVVGLKGTGDANITDRTRKAVTQALQEGGPGVPDNPDLYRPGNVAYVTIIANVPSNYRPGDKMDALMSTLGDATDLRGGILLPSPLRGVDDQVYALAQGAINPEMVGLEGVGLEGFDGPMTRARISGGAIINQPTLLTSGLR